MNEVRKALLLVGSPRGQRSTSGSIGDYLISKLEEFGIIAEKRFIHRVVNHEDKIQELLKLINSVDIIILSFPLYIDCLPAPVIKVMELVKEERDKLDQKNIPALIAICNNGFPESSQNLLALRICEDVSEECGFEWKGGFAVGGGGSLSGAPLHKAKSALAKNLIKAMDMTANSIKDNKDIPQQAFDKASKKYVSYNMYRIFANLGFRLALHPGWLTVLIITGLILLILGTPMTIIGGISNDTIGLNIGIANLVIGINCFLNGIIFRMNIKKLNTF